MGFSHEVKVFRDEIGWACRCIAGPHDKSDESMESLRSSFWIAAMSLAFVVALACLVLWWRGKIGSELSVDSGKWCAVAGVYFAGWGTWLGLLFGGGHATWGGKAPHELASAGFFKLFFLTGVLFATIGSAWWV
jgi:hypothetical protein